MIMKKELKVIGKSTVKIDGKERVSGRSVYGHDIELPNMLHGLILRTKYPCAEIRSICLSVSLAMSNILVLSFRRADLR